ncbi:MULTISPECIES: gas vesicle protein [unclassified Streptomyces]|uniref:gas vesicle protein GvpO n=1 Tax=unclassified Streptomyces TaxID=2593676 RepID=UPI002271A7FD|nr:MULTISPECIES: gas vesicle protein [unclassified Streptomyces]MCY0962441.1 gas vesicle protein [Streptomyces sp. H27-H5]
MAAAEPARPRRVSSHAAGEGEAQDRRTPRRTPPRRRSAAPGPAVAMRAAAQQLAELLGRLPDSVSSLKPTEDGWEAHVEVVELERIPDTTSVMASYRVTLDGEGELISYERTRRYTRGMIDRPT